VNRHQRARKHERLRRTLLRTFVWVLLVAFLLTSVGVALFVVSVR
jgi:hypothetical protein